MPFSVLSRIWSCRGYIRDIQGGSKVTCPKNFRLFLPHVKSQRKEFIGKIWGKLLLTHPVHNTIQYKFIRTIHT
jgi:hypothetical protein